MKKKQFIISLLVSLFLLTSCKKSTKENIVDTSNCPIKEIKGDFGSTFLSYSGNKIIGYEIKENNVLVEKVILSYEANKITKTSTSSDGTKHTYIYNLNTGGFITSAQKTSSSVAINGAYTYNSQNQLTQIKTTVGTFNFTYNLKYTDGNMTSSERGTFTYNKLEPYQNLVALAHPLVLSNDLLEELGDFAIIANGSFGVAPKNLVTSRTSNTANYTYEKNNTGAVTSFTENYSAFTSTIKFIRKCD